MIKKIWFLLLSVGIIYSFIMGNDRMGDIILNTSYDTWEMIVSIAPLVVLWSGIMNIASESGLLYKFSKLLRPLLKRLMPSALAVTIHSDNVSVRITAKIMHRLNRYL